MGPPFLCLCRDQHLNDGQFSISSRFCVELPPTKLRRRRIVATGSDRPSHVATLSARFSIPVQGSQFTFFDCTDRLKRAKIKISLDGKARYLANIFIERLRRSLKYECVYLQVWETGSQAKAGVGRWITFYNYSGPVRHISLIFPIIFPCQGGYPTSHPTKKNAWNELGSGLRRWATRTTGKTDPCCPRQFQTFCPVKKFAPRA